jgi:hypothetical protein
MTPSALRAPRVLVVSLRKSGAHLIREVALNLGYSLYGEVFATPEDQPLLRREQVWRILQLVYPPHELEDLTRSDDKPAIAEAIRTGLAAMNEVWRERLAVPWTGGLATPPAVRRLAADVRNRAEELSFSDLPEDSSWILHQLPLTRVAPDFLQSWAQTASPRIISGSGRAIPVLQGREEAPVLAASGRFCPRMYSLTIDSGAPPADAAK